jgi:rhamnosyltransferase subunit B
MHVLLVTAGSHGDVNPVLSLGRALQERGHRATVLVNPYYERQVLEAGLGFEPCGEYLDLKRVGELYPDIMHPWRGPQTVVDAMLVPTSREAFRRVHEIAAAGDVHAVAAHMVVPGASWAAEALGLPYANIVLSPLIWASRHEPLVGASLMPPEPLRFMRPVLRAIMLAVMTRTFDGPLKRLRRELGLPPGRGHIMQAARGGPLNLGLWSPHLRGPLPDDPPTGRICGFAWHDRHGEVESPPADVEQFLRDGDAPVLFCLGTAAVHVAGDFYDHAAAACAQLGCRGLLLTGPGRTAPGNLPRGVRAFAYTPFSTTMPRCAVNIHHGGVGSTGQAMRAGRPTVVVPHAHDQWDNAARVFRLGLSRTVGRPSVRARTLARAIGAVLNDAETARRASEIGARMQGEDGAAVAVGHLEALVSRTTAARIGLP